MKKPATRIKIDGKTVKKPVVTVGSKTALTAVSAPKDSKITFKSSDETVATVSADGTLTALKAGTVNIAATNLLGAKYVINVTVKESVAELAEVTQTASNAFTATFTADASKTITKDDFKVVAADGTVELAVKSVEYSADGLSAKVTVFGNFTNAVAYKITCKEKVVDLTAKVGAVSRIAINTASAEVNVETPIEFTLFDAEGIDVTPSVALDTTCYVSVTGNYSAAILDRASKARITMNVVGDKADVTVIYNSNTAGAQDITATQTITCVDAKVTQGTKLFVNSNNTNATSQCAKFYLGLSDSSVSVAEGNSTSNVYFCAKDAKGDVISYDSYEVESSNDDVASASVSVGSGKYAQITVTGNTVGSATLNVKATKNGKDAYYTIPVMVTKQAELASMRLSVTRPVMSDVNDTDYKGYVIAELYDKDGNRIDGNVSCSLVDTTATTPIEVQTLSYNMWTGVAGYYTAANADARSYTIKVTAADKTTGKTIERNITVTVKALAEASQLASGLKLTYQIELDRNVVDESPQGVAGTSDDSVTARLYATYNGLFAGYVRNDGAGNFTVAEGNVTPAETLDNVTVAAKFGTKIYTGSLCGDGVANVGTNYVGITTSGSITFDSVVTSGGAIRWTPEGSANLAKTGVYTIEYRIYSTKGTHTDKDKGNAKYTPRTQTFTVKNSVIIPTVTVTSRIADSLSFSSIQENLKTNVDMNNNTNDYISISGIAKDKTGASPVISTNGKTMTVKYAIVDDVYNGVTWNFFVPINSTFRLE